MDMRRTAVVRPDSIRCLRDLVQTTAHEKTGTGNYTVELVVGNLRTSFEQIHAEGSAID